MSSLLVSRAAKPWQGRALEGSGGRRALLDPWVLRGKVVTLKSQEPPSLCRPRALLDPWVLHGKPSPFGRASLAGGSGARFWTRFCVEMSSLLVSRARNLGRGVL